MSIFTLTVLFPLLSFIILSIFHEKLSDNMLTVVGVMGIGISTLITMYLVCSFYFNSYEYSTFIVLQELWSWFKINKLHVTIMFRLDALSLTMLSVVNSIGFIIHIYAIWYMKQHEGYIRFFVYTNLFMFNMMVLILSDNLLLMFFGWEGVGLCSYLLIGLYYSNPKHGIEAFKAFIMTRFGDICLLCALFMIYDQFHTFSLNELLMLSSEKLFNNMSVWISVLILIGSLGKSAQIPFYTWLIGAMVGPTPVSALIHAATMVTSGVYLIVRMHNFFLITPIILYMIGIIGAVTLVLSSFSAIFQNNIKRILAYSTVSQIGYMFLAIGGKNWLGAIFHLVTHACSKALLFLAAGVVVRVYNNEQNIFKIRTSFCVNPFIYICFLVGGLSLSGVPIITAGFYSKECIFSHIFFKNNDYFLLLLGLLGTFLTSVYFSRMIFIIFHRKRIIDMKINYTVYQYVALIILLLLSIFIGALVQFLIIDISTRYNYGNAQIYLILVSEILVFFGIWVSSLFWLNYQLTSNLYKIFGVNSSVKIIRYLKLLCHYGWGIDWLYRIIFIRLYLWLTRKLFDINNKMIGITIDIFEIFSYLGKYLVCIDNRVLNWYAASIGIGVITMLFVILMNSFIWYIYIQ